MCIAAYKKEILKYIDPRNLLDFLFSYQNDLILLFSVIMQLGIQKRKKRDGGENRQAKVNVLQIDTDTRKMLSFIYIKEW